MPLLQSLNVATAHELHIDGRTVVSAIGQLSVEGRVEVKRLGLVGDEQADLSVHGGLAKSLYAYPIEHYPFWQTVRAQAQVAEWGAPLPCGFMGENLSIAGLLENQVRSEEHTSELQSRVDLVCRLLLEKKNTL